mmetsp:Transcript_42952/g.73276  ORF Transcript_42952/g.73276 Transcript_42952/m.73276 type:complete len:85 (-) Transcript_42952:433-687(-)
MRLEIHGDCLEEEEAEAVEERKRRSPVNQTYRRKTASSAVVHLRGGKSGRGAGMRSLAVRRVAMQRDDQWRRRVDNFVLDYVFV